MNPKRKQTGVTLSGLLMACVVLGSVALLAMKLWPLYNEKLKVDLAMESLVSLPDGERLGRASLANALQRQFDVQDVDSIDSRKLPKLLEVERRKGQKGKFVRLAYEIRAPFFSNLDVIMNYDKTVQIGTVATD
ncbi:MAG: DUF4845 domain-containing protein [Gammaproteobacteria bacterium]